MAGEPNENVTLLTAAIVEVDSSGDNPPHGRAPALAEPPGHIAFLDLPGFEGPLPMVYAGSASLHAGVIARVEAWLRGSPGQLEALARGEDVIDIREVSGNGIVLQLVPIVGEDTLQGIVCLGQHDGPPAPGLDEAKAPWKLAAGMVRAIARIKEPRNRADGQRCLLDELANENRDLREQRDLLRRQIEDQMKLVSSTVHQLRNPLVAVRGYVRMALKEEIGPITETQRECLGVVMENANRMTGLLGDLSRSVAEQPLHYQRFDFVELWRESREVFNPQVSRKSIEFVERLPEGRLIISGDRDKLALVLYKVLANTIKFTGQDGRIDARLSRDRDQVSLTVCDTADGIPPELVEEALGCRQPRPSGAAPQSGPEKPASSLVHEIVNLHGGEILVTSGMNKGWRVTLRVPVANRADPPK